MDAKEFQQLRTDVGKFVRDFRSSHNDMTRFSLNLLSPHTETHLARKDDPGLGIGMFVQGSACAWSGSYMKERSARAMRCSLEFYRTAGAQLKVLFTE